MARAQAMMTSKVKQSSPCCLHLYSGHLDGFEAALAGASPDRQVEQAESFLSHRNIHVFVCVCVYFKANKHCIEMHFWICVCL